MNIYSLLFELIKDRSYDRSFERVLISLGEAVSESSKAIDKVTLGGINECIESIVDEECAFIESLLGTGFVACQAELNAVVAYIRRLHEAARLQGKILSSTDGKKESILALQSQPVATSGYTQMQVINAFANYFKHSEEWNGGWASLSGNQAQTAKVLISVGTVEYSTGILRTGAKALGVNDYREMKIFAEHVQKWSSQVLQTYSSEIRKLGLA